MKMLRRNKFVIAFIIFSIGVLFIQTKYILVKVDGSSMSPAFRDGQYVIVEKNINEEFVVGDVVVFIKNDTCYVKRIVATHSRKTILFSPPEDSYAVMGDNIGDSYDSLYWEEPYINNKDILGRVIVY